MTHALDIHPASPDEVIAAHTNVFEQWSKGRSLQQHLDFLRDAPSHRRATWFVGCVQGAVVASLGAYPFQFLVDGRLISGVGIGSVFTARDFRRRGYAAKLLDWVDAYHRERGVGMSCLYSDIDAGYYARLGYVLCPSFEGWPRPPGELRQNSNDADFSLVEFAVRDALEEVAAMYGEYHAAAPISIARDAAYWQSIIDRFPNDRYFWLQEPWGSRAAYVRIHSTETACRIMDYALANRDHELAAEFYAALVATAGNWDCERVGGWLPSTPAAHSYFDIEPRTKELTMIKPLAYDGELSPAAIAATSFFCEIDHV